MKSPTTMPTFKGAPRVVGRAVRHGEPIDFRELCRRAIPTEARFVVLDLDRTTHLERNLGELLGWELCAHLAFGPERLELALERGERGRFLLDARRPLALTRYVWLGAKLWAYPGLFYLVWGKLAGSSARQRRRAYRTFGPEPVREIQSVPQLALMQQLAVLPPETARQLALSVWRRHSADLVIARGDIALLRERCPGVKIVLASASPTAMLEVAARELGVDDFIASEVTGDGERPALPVNLRRPMLLSSRKPPESVGLTDQVCINSGPAKIARLRERYPEMFAEGAVSVGISDNGYGEDGCWAEHFTHVIAVNSTTPFAPIVSNGSPLREAHTVALLSQGERAARADGDPSFLDPRRSARPTGPASERSRDELDALLADTLDAVGEETRRIEQAEADIAAERGARQQEAEAARAQVEADVAAFNRAPAPGRSRALRTLERDVRALARMRARIAEVERPVSEATYERSLLLDSAKALAYAAA